MSEIVDLVGGTLSIRPSILYYGTPVALLSTMNEDGSVNLAPMSSSWALGYRVVLGLGKGGQTFINLERSRECVINLPSPEMWKHVEALADLTGRQDMPPWKVEMGYRFERDKFQAAGLTPIASETVAPPRVHECPLQLEARVARIHGGGESGDEFAIVETEVLRVHAKRAIVKGNGRHVDPGKWSPLLYVFRHYFGTGKELGKTFPAET